MEFACGFVYVSPATGVSSGPNKIKRSALLPPREARHPCNYQPVNPPKPHSALLPPPTRTRPKHQPPVTPPPSRTRPKHQPPVTPLPPPNLTEHHTTPPSPQTSRSPKSQGPVSSQTLPSGSLPIYTPVYENLNFNVKEPNTTTYTVNAPSTLWRNHLVHTKTPHPPEAKPVRKPQISPDGLMTYEFPMPEQEEKPYDISHFCSVSEGSGINRKPPLTPNNRKAPQKPAGAPPLPPRPLFMKQCPDYDVVLPSSSSPSSSSLVPSTRFGQDHPAASSTPGGEGDKQLLPGNPNVLLVGLGGLVSEDHCECVLGEPSHCSQCGSVLESCYDNVVKECYFCQSWVSAPQWPTGCEDCLFLLNPDDSCHLPDGGLLLFCVGTSVTLSTQSVQKAVLQCIQSLSKTQPDIGIMLVTFSDVVTVHGYGDFPSRVLEGEELRNSVYLREVGLSWPTPPPLSQIQTGLQVDIYRLQESDTIALGPAALVSIMMASKHPGSKVLLVTDGVANAGLGSLNCDTHSLVSSSIFYQQLGETAAAQGVSVSVVAVRGADCRLEELGRLTDKTGGKVVIAGFDDLFTEFMRLIEDRNIATHCTVTLLLPTVMRVTGERDAGHCCRRELGNVTKESEVTFQYGETEKAYALHHVRRVSVQLQVSFRRWDGMSMLRVLTATLETTEDSSQVLSSLRVPVLLQNMCQTTAALALRGRAREALRERDMQEHLILQALEYRQNVKDQLMYTEWLKTTKPIFNKICTTYILPDIDAALMYAMKNCYYRRLSLC